VETDAPITVRLFLPTIGYFAEDELELVARPGDAFVNPALRFVEGDEVRVLEDVMVKGSNARSECGVVVHTWVICETDPACCCAELVTDASIQVNLVGRECSETAVGEEALGYFAEHELRRIS